MVYVWWLLAMLLHVGQVHAAKPSTPEIIHVPLTIHVASEAGVAVVDESRILDAVIRANLALRDHGVVLWVRAILPMPMPDDAAIETTDERFDLARSAARDGTIHVFWVERVHLTNPAKGDRRVSGMHWRYRGPKRDVRRREYVAIARSAPATTLVHEVGHTFGLRHVEDFDNLMCSCQRGRRPMFDAQQGLRLRIGARRFLARSHAPQRQRD